ncbi:Sperm-associated antigen 6, partial [Tetrabaena socialis]
APPQVPQVRRAAAALLLQLARKTPALAADVCAGGCPASLAKYLQMERAGEGCATGVTLAGTLASYSPSAAKAVVDAGVGAEVVAALRRGDGDGASAPAPAVGASGLGGGAAGASAMSLGSAKASSKSVVGGGSVKSVAGGSVKSAGSGGGARKAGGGGGGGGGAGPGGGVPAAAAWALEQMAQHGEETAMPLIAQGALMAALDGYLATAEAAAAAPDGGDAAIFSRCKAALKSLLRGCSSTAPLEPLVLHGTPPPVLKHVLRRAAPLLAGDAKSRQQFVTSGGLMRLQELEGRLCGKGRAQLEAIN